ncbi:hypothetical protein AB3X91_33730 [Paraburkholderia sp. BR14263]|uniref:hypothetical protein n=1 Tax=unclassified Paraburkholderia TaxID=2615204 RepID=UPI0034CDCFBE
MEGLVLKTGGKLEYANAAVDETGNAFDTEVTENAVSYLMDSVRFEGEVYVRDIFALLESNPVLLQVFARMHASEYLDEAREVSARPYIGEYDPEGIEYLELCPDWEMDNLTGLVTERHRLCLRGVGFELREEFKFSGCSYEKGNRIRYAIAYSPLADLLNLPARIETEVHVTHGDDDAENFLGAHRTVHVSPTLGQVIDGVLYEISFGGSPTDKAGLANSLKALADDDEQWTTYDSAEDLLRSMGLAEYLGRAAR